MSRETGETEASSLLEAARQIEASAAAEKCWGCGCLHGSLDAIHRAIPEERQPPSLRQAVERARGRLTPVRYDCLGCQVCYPALAMNALNESGVVPTSGLDPCPADKVEERPGWPPLPGSYVALRYQASVAVCTLTDEGLYASLKDGGAPGLSVVGTLQTENLGIERLIVNVTANPHIRRLILCGADTRQAIGHLPGQSLLALAESGVDDNGRIVGAKGRRPVLRNVGRDIVEHFRRTVNVADMIGESRLEPVLEAIQVFAARNPGPAAPLKPANLVAPIPGYLPERMVPDPAGYFVIYVDPVRRTLSLEHYRNDGALDVIIEGISAAELYVPAVQKGLLTRLDHAAYLGCELARAERALRAGETYVQDGAPERKGAADKPSCGGGSSCGEAGG